MGQVAATFVCPKGHASTEPDYCSECGAKIAGGTVASAPPQGASAAGMGDVCPDCGTLREGNSVVFCEVCGYNFVSGAHGEVPVLQAAHDPVAADMVAPAADSADLAAPGPGLHWTAFVSVDPALRSAESPEAPTDVLPFTVTLQGESSLIGRRNEARGIFPEITLTHDEAVSRRHALLQLDPQRGLLLRDIGAANGTRLNGKELQPMVDYELHDGDEITLGHWSRIRVQGS